jgi:hypothetical protein
MQRATVTFLQTGDKDTDLRRIRILVKSFLSRQTDDAEDLFSIEIHEGKHPKIFDWAEPVKLSDDFIAGLQSKGYKIKFESLDAPAVNPDDY